MGAGKTTVGAALAARLGRTFLDSDRQVEARTGQTVAEIFAARGEPAFRAEESAALADALASPQAVVVAAAGGTVLDPANRAAIKSAGCVVWLRAAPAVLAQRVAPGDHRPLLASDPAGSLARLDGVRRPLYAELADVTLDVEGCSVDALVDKIVKAVATEDPAC